ncbi:acetyltransferase [Arthrobacter sp. AK01]|uniref:acetyltransferase n=1 Tax=Micrococcaceae TaxID=1268 RepID=UPI001E3C59F4|nr:MULTISPECIES: acetyltransferase [Micrococcaceae]MCD4851059.1 acetyltransferase [Arthrobacter sp. AK01]MCP1414112.1 sugar O-acyltransferase (sialic acid O-acetyltransferase NeuD family) [Paenarthrobacter sp. A20]
MSELLLIAASGLAREVLAMVRSSGPFDVIGILDDDEDKLGRVVDGAHVLGPIRDALKFPHALLLICIGSGAGRESVVMRLRTLGLDEDRYATAIDPSVQVPEGCLIGRGSILLAHVSMTASVTIGNHVVAMPGVTFTHDDEISDFATFASGVSLGGNVHIGRAAYIGMNASVRERTSVGANATIGMGAAVLTDVPDDETWAGVPARVIRRGNSPALEGIQ